MTVVTVLHPPISVAVAAGVRELPAAPGRFSFEQKLDGYRCLAFGAQGLLQSRQGNTALTDRFPEVLADLARLGDVVVDGELVALRHGRLEFAALQTGPTRRAREQVVAILILFDLLASNDKDLRGQPYRERREALEELLTPGLPHVQLITRTRDPQIAQEWMAPGWGEAGVEGIVAKPCGSRYLAGTRSGWLKLRTRATTEAVVLGATGSNTLVLGYPGRAERWRVLGLSHPVAPVLRSELAARLRPDPARLEPVRLPGSAVGFPGSPEVVFQPVRVDTVVEIEADMARDHGRLRHRSHVLRIRNDLTPDDLRFRSSGPGAGPR